MKDKIIITGIPYGLAPVDAADGENDPDAVDQAERTRLFFCRVNEQGKLTEIRSGQNDHYPLGSIYVGRVQKILKDINGAFIEIAPGFTCFYHLDKNQEPVFVRKNASRQLQQGDELLVQIERDAVKTKQPQVTSNLNLAGRFLVLTSGNRKFGISSKLPESDRSRFHGLLDPYYDGSFGIVVRTNAAGVSDQQILKEFHELKQSLDQILQYGTTRACFTRIADPEPFWLEQVKGVYPDTISEIVTDEAEIYDRLKEYTGLYEDFSGIPVRLYQDPEYDLYKVYSLKQQLEHARSARVWMKSGAFLVIEPTEALTVIDVNSGKHVSKKDPEAQHLAVNLEAADEICRQMRLRNLSGIIIVDFINLEKEDNRRTLFTYLKMAVKADPVPVQVVDQTQLGLIEITRKKTAKTLEEQLT